MALPPTDKRAATDEAFLREVDDAVRAGDLENFWKRYGRWLAIALVVGLAAFGGWIYWQNQQQAAAKVKKKINLKYDEVGGDIKVGIKVLMKKNHQVGEVIEIRGKKAIVKLGMLPITVDLEQLVVVKDKPAEETTS